MPSSLNRIWTVSVCVSDMEKSLEFYTGKLGFEVALESKQNNWVELALPEGFAKIALTEPSKEFGEEFYEWASQNVGVKTGISLETKNVQEVYDTLSSKGVKFSGPPEKTHWGGIMTTILDPDGNEIQVVEDPEHYTRT